MVLLPLPDRHPGLSLDGSSPPPSPLAAGEDKPEWYIRTEAWRRHSAFSELSQLNTREAPRAESPCLQMYVRILQDCHLSLIHIPLELYPHFVHAVLSLILPEAHAQGLAPNDDYSCDRSDFFNISVTPVECSVVCTQEAAQRFFAPIINSLDPSVCGEVSISPDEYVAIQVDGEGLDAGQRVLDLTSPLAQAKV